jgi:hypothetical protein
MDIQIKNLEKKIQTIKSHIYSDVIPFKNIKFKEGDLPEMEINFCRTVLGWQRFDFLVQDSRRCPKN